MNSVAIPASAASPALSAESDLIRQAARGNVDAFEELYRRHGQTAWRLAQAVASDRDSATEAVREGFARSLRSYRRTRFSDASEATYRNQLLAATYRRAADSTRDRIPAAPKATRRAKTADAAFTEAAFRSLPERWRGALWLTEVESFEPERVAAVLGVSNAVSVQLIARGRRGLAGRFAQSRQPEPAHLGPAFRAFAIAVPANLSDLAQAGWASGGADRQAILAPLTSWLEERAFRPMWVSVAALLGLGVIGIGVLAPGTTFRSNLGLGATSSAGALPVPTCYGVPCPATAGVTQAGGFFTGFGTGAVGAADGAAAAAAAATGGAAAHSTTPTAPSPTNTQRRSTSGGTTNPSTGGHGSNPGTGTITEPVNVPGVANVTESRSTYTVNVLPSGSGAAASVIVNCSTPVGLVVGDTKVGCGSTAPAATPTAPSASPTGSTAGSTVSHAVNEVTGTLNSGL